MPVQNNSLLAPVTASSATSDPSVSRAWGSSCGDGQLSQLPFQQSVKSVNLRAVQSNWAVLGVCVFRMASRQSITPRAGAATAAARKSSVTPTSIPATALSKHNTRRTSRDARGEKRSEATAAAAAHEEAVATSTAVVGVKPQSSMMVRSGRGRSGSRSGDLGPNSRQPSARDGALSATSIADTAYSPPVGPRQGAPLPLGTRWSPLARPTHAGGPSATGHGNFSANKAGRVQHPVFVGNPDQAKTQEDQVRAKTK